MMRTLFTIIAVSFLAVSLLAQPPAAPLATARGVSVSAADLSPEGRRIQENLSRLIAESRTNVLSAYLAELLLEAEASARGITVERLQAEAVKAVPDPTAAEIQAVYDQNRAVIGNVPLADVRGRIVELLRREPEQKALQSQVAALQAKFGLKLVKDVNTAGLKPLDVVATFNGESLTVAEFEEKKKIELYDAKAHFYDELRLDVEYALYNKLVLAEAAAQNIAASELIAREITNRSRDFSDEERLDLEYALQSRLFAKYGAKIMIDEPAPLVLPVTADDDPFTGPQAAPVTIVMFSDFQCPACARTHPVLKRVVAEYGAKARLVVRDFPLESIHPNAFTAALAANAVRSQGKYFEFVDILYRRQDALDLESIKKYASELGLDVARLITDMARAENAAEIRKDVADGSLFGINGTPTIFVNGVKVHRLSGPAFRAAIDRALSGK